MAKADGHLRHTTAKADGHLKAHPHLNKERPLEILEVVLR